MNAHRRAGGGAPRRVLVLGGRGLLGCDVVSVARQERGYEVSGPGHAELDICDPAQVKLVLEGFAPDLVVNCAAFTAVDECEEADRWPRIEAVNARAPGLLAAQVATLGSVLIHVSSDYVFAGTAVRPYDEEAPTAPLSAYGRSKLAGEDAVLAAPSGVVVRSSWVFGKEGPNFVRTMLSLAEQGTPLRVVDDQIGRPTYSWFLARALLDVGEAIFASRSALRLWHYGNSEPVSWLQFAREIFEVWGLRPRLSATTTEEFERPAPRPRYSVLDCSRIEALRGHAVECWRDGLRHLEARMESAGRTA